MVRLPYFCEKVSKTANPKWLQARIQVNLLLKNFICSSLSVPRFTRLQRCHQLKSPERWVNARLSFLNGTSEIWQTPIIFMTHREKGVQSQLSPRKTWLNSLIAKGNWVKVWLFFVTSSAFLLDQFQMALRNSGCLHIGEACSHVWKRNTSESD